MEHSAVSLCVLRNIAVHRTCSHLVGVIPLHGPHARWKELVQGVMARFMHNQQQVLLRRLYHISQLTTVEDYVQRYSDLVDQLQAHGTQSDRLHYLTRFLDGLMPAVRVLVAIQQPADLDTSYTLALLYEDLGDGSNPLQSQSTIGSTSRRPPSVTPTAQPPPPAKWISRTVEERKQSESGRQGAEDKWKNLKAYMRAKNLCFMCGEKYSRDHKCKNTIQLHVVQEMVEFLQDSDSEHVEGGTEAPNHHLLMLSVAATQLAVNAPKTLHTSVLVQGKDLLFLIDR